MLPATSRLRRSADYAAVVKQGHRARRGGLVVHAMNRKEDAAGARAGFIVSKAVGSAVTRNLIKRRLRHAVAARVCQWAPDLDVVVRALPSSASADFHRLSVDLDAALTAANRRRR